MATVEVMRSPRRLLSYLALLFACFLMFTPVHAARGQAARELSLAASTRSTVVKPSAGEALRTTLQTVAILVAVTVFLTREGLEAQRRKKTRQRKLAAIHTIIARACELNNWAVKSLKRQLSSMRALEDAVYEGIPNSEFSVSFRRDGRCVLIRKEDGVVCGGSPIFEVHLDDLKSNLLDVAELDTELLAAMDAAISALEDVRHVQSSLVSHLLGEDEFVAQMDDFLPGFVSYARGEMDHAFDALEALYLRCAGKSLTDYRIR